MAPFIVFHHKKIFFVTIAFVYTYTYYRMTHIWDIAAKHNRLCKTKADAKANIDALVEQVRQRVPLGLDTGMLTSLLDDTMHFHKWTWVMRDSSLQTPHQIVAEFRRKMRMSKFVSAFKTALATNHPVICEIATYMLVNDCVKKHWTPKMTQTVKQTLHTMYIYEAITRYASANSSFPIELINYYNTMKWTHKKSTTNLLLNTNSAFSFVKAESVVWCFDRFYQMRTVHQSAISASNKTHIKKKLGKEIALGLKTNIYEAIFADKYINTSASRINARAAQNGLITHPCGIAHYEQSAETISFPQMTQLYTSMYTSWNLCFVCLFSPAPLLYAKLLYPYLAGSPPKSFIFRRAVSLLIAVNSVLCNQLNNISTESHKFDVPHLQLMMAKSNLLYANEMLRMHRGTPKSRLQKHATFVKSVPKTIKNIQMMYESKPFDQYASRKKYKVPTVDAIYVQYMME